MKTGTSRAWSLLGVLALTACESDPVRNCDPCSTSAVLYGEVKDSQGIPAPQVPFSMVVYEVDSCGGNPKQIARFRTDGLGEFSGLVRTPVGSFVARCFLLTIDPDSSSEWPTQELQVQDSVWFLPDLGNEPRDSLRMELDLVEADTIQTFR